MKPPIFDYVAPTSLDEALESLAEYGEDAKLLAGGQSLVPMLNFRLARPRYLIDLNGIPALDYVRADGRAGLVIGAMTRQRALERSPLVRERCPLVSEAMPWVGHFQIRNRGTIGGSLAHADPAAELPAVVSALDGRLVLRSARAERIVDPDDFFVSYLTTSLAPSEMLVEIRLPGTGPRTGYAFIEVSRRHGDFALVGVATLLALDDGGVCTRAAIALTGVGPAPVRARAAEAALVGARPDAAAFEDVARRVREAVNPPADIHASADYRRHVSGVLCRRALEAAAARARGAEPARGETGTA